MTSGVEGISAQTIRSQEQTLATLNRLFDVTQTGTLFSQPISVGDATVITASEVQVGVGVGFGSGTGPGEGEGQPSGAGGGGGGGGASLGRPVAAIIVDRGGVRVEPIVDVTKIAVVLFTALGAIFIGVGRMQKAARS